MKKRIFTVLTMTMIFTVLISASFSSVANARDSVKEKPNVPSGIIIPSQEEIENYYNSLGSEERTRLACKMREALRFSAAKSPSARGLITVPGSFTIFQQEDPDWCAAATLKSIFMYINGFSYSQATIASDLGYPSEDPSIWSVWKYLNNHQNRYYYSLTNKANFNQNGLVAILNYTISTAQLPAMLFIVAGSYDGWPYTTDGHTLVAYGLNSTYNLVQIADPYGGTYPWISSYYGIGSQTVYNVCEALAW